MSERTIIFSYQGEEKEVGQFANYEECKRAFQNEFSLSDEDMQKISLYYFDNENDQTMISSNEDYNIFLETGYTTIEGVMEEEKPDPMRSATVFKIKREEPEKEINLKNSIDSSIIDNSFNNSLENSANIIVKKTNSDGIDSANVNEMNNLNKIMELTFEDKKKENMIEELKKQMEELKLKHQVEMEKKEEENQKKYNEAIARKENEIKKKIKEEKEKQLKD